MRAVTRPDPARSLDADLVAWGKVVVLETVGRTTGHPRRVAVGFTEDESGAILVAASSDAAHWAQNLAADPSCHIERDGSRVACRAASLPDDERNAVVAGLILKYGTPSEQLGGGPAFRIAPIARE